MEKKRVIRLLIEDHEDVIYWDQDIDKPTLHALVTYINDGLRKKYSTDSFSYMDFENKHYTLDDVVEFERTPIFINIPHRKDIQTFKKVDPRTMKNVFIFKDKDSVRIQKFENLQRNEEFILTLDEIKKQNEENKKLNFDDPILSADLSTKLKIEVKPVEEEQKDSPKFGGNSKANETFGGGSKFMPANNNANPPQQQNKGFLGVDALEPDMKKWGRVPMKNNQEDFIKMNEMNKNPLGKKVELQMYTLDDVKQHNRSGDAWMVINGKVYDVTKYIPYHPGGNKILMGVGKDGTSLYNKYHPWVNANFLLEKYHIGFLKK
jgi:cytochrome-b5 reductase